MSERNRRRRTEDLQMSDRSRRRRDAYAPETYGNREQRARRPRPSGGKRRRTSKGRIPRPKGAMDYNLLTVIIFLVCFGLVMLYSTSYYQAQLKFNDGFHYFKRQAIFSSAEPIAPNRGWVIRNDNQSCITYPSKMIKILMCRHFPGKYHVGFCFWLFL